MASQLEPPYPNPLPPLVVSVGSRELLETVAWLCDRVKDHRSELGQLGQLVQRLQEEERQREEAARQREGLVSQRCDLLEGFVRRGAQARDPVLSGGGTAHLEALSGDLFPGAGAGAVAEDAAPAAPAADGRRASAASGGLSAAAAAAAGPGADGERAVRDLELQVASCQMMQKKLEQYMRHQEQQQTSREGSQYELLKLELQKLSRDTEARLRDKDLEPLRNLVASTTQRLQTEVQAEVQRMGTNLKDSLHAQLGDVQATIEKIAGTTEQQVRLLDGKVEKSSAEETQRHERGSRQLADLGHQVSFLAGQFGISADQLEAVAKSDPVGGDGGAVPSPAVPSPAGQAGTADRRRSSAASGALAAPGTPLGELGSRVAQVEQWLQQLAAEVGAPLEERGGDRGRGESIDAGSCASSQPGSRHALRFEAIEARLGELAAVVGVGPVAPAAGLQTTGRSGSGQAAPALPARVGLVEAKVDEVAAAMGINPRELEAAALSEATGSFARRVVLREQAEGLSPRMAGIVAAHGDRLVGIDGRLRQLDARVAILEDLERAVAGTSGGSLPADSEQLEGRLSSAGGALSAGSISMAPGAAARGRPAKKGADALGGMSGEAAPSAKGVIGGGADAIGSMSGEAASSANRLVGGGAHALGGMSGEATSSAKRLVGGGADASGGTSAEAASPAIKSGGGAADALGGMSGAAASSAKRLVGRGADALGGMSTEAASSTRRPVGGIADALGGMSGAAASSATRLVGRGADSPGGRSNEAASSARSGEDAAAAPAPASPAHLAWEVQGLKRDLAEVRRRLEDLQGEPGRGRQAGAGGASGSGPHPSSGTDRGSRNSDSVQRAEKAAKIAEAAAAAASRLRAELEEIVRAVEVPSTITNAGLFEDSLTGNAEEPGEATNEKEQAEATAEYVERQFAMEQRLQLLEEQLESASVTQPEDGEVFRGLGTAIKDIRQCLSRCELLYQLPEVRLFVKRFQKSLRVNAILHERWVGPGAGKPQSSPEEADEPPGLPSGSRRGSQGGLAHGSEHARSTPDLGAVRARREAAVGAYVGRRGGDGKKKPFRTVVDWCRPHTPLKVDPIYGGRAGLGQAAAAPSSVEHGPHLPQLVPKG